MCLSRSFNKSSEGLFCALGLGLDARDWLQPRQLRKAPVLRGLVFWHTDNGQVMTWIKRASNGGGLAGSVWGGRGRRP